MLQFIIAEYAVEDIFKMIGAVDESKLDPFSKQGIAETPLLKVCEYGEKYTLLLNKYHFIEEQVNFSYLTFLL